MTERVTVDIPHAKNQTVSNCNGHGDRRRERVPERVPENNSLHYIYRHEKSADSFRAYFKPSISRP